VKVAKLNSKYGRLFTEADVRKYIEGLGGVDFSGSIDDDSELSTVESTFPEDEPLFVLRAKDRRALGAVRFYYTHQSNYVTDKHLQGIERAIKAFDEFRNQHPERLKEPD
jgi:hypothetical protein